MNDETDLSSHIHPLISNTNVYKAQKKEKNDLTVVLLKETIYTSKQKGPNPKLQRFFNRQNKKSLVRKKAGTTTKKKMPF